MKLLPVIMLIIFSGSCSLSYSRLTVFSFTVEPYLTYSDSVNTDSVKSFSIKTDSVKTDSLNPNIKTPKGGQVKNNRPDDEHPQDVAESRGFKIYSKDSASSIQLFASIRVFGAYDINGLKGGTSFNISDIPTGNANKNEKSFFMTAQLTRFGIHGFLKRVLDGIEVKIEADFNASENSFRLRHAWGRSNHILAGQTWSVFSDVKSVPTTVEVDGPPTAVKLRTIQVRYTGDISRTWQYVVGLESPNPSVNVPDSLSLEPVSQSYPDVTGRIIKSWKASHIQLSGILRSISVRNLDGTLGTKTGYGFLLSSLASMGNGFQFMGQALIGAGISSHLNLSSNSAIDVILDPSSGTYEVNTCYGGFVSLSKKILFRSMVLSLVYGYIKILPKDIQPGYYFNWGQYATASLFWLSKFGSRIGAEYIFGYSKNKAGEFGTANRVAFTFYYDF